MRLPLLVSVEMIGSENKEEKIRAPHESRSLADVKERILELVRKSEEAKRLNRVFKRHKVESELIHLLNRAGKHSEALAKAQKLLKELKKIGDKDIKVFVELEESISYYYITNLSKSRASLISARTTANSIYIPPKLQAALDIQSGILHAADEKDYKTAYSYFYEAFEGFDSTDETADACRALNADDIKSLLTNKACEKYLNFGAIKAMQDVAGAARERSLHKMIQAFDGRWKHELFEDTVVKIHFESLKDTMFERNLLRIVQPYSRVEIRFVANKIALPETLVEKKLSQMILDEKINGYLNQGEGLLIVLEPPEKDETLDTVLAVLRGVDKVVDKLISRSRVLIY